MVQQIIGFFTAFLLTNALEAVPFFLLIKRPFQQKLTILLLINSLTLPLVWIFLPLFYEYYFFAFLAAEALVIAAETALIKFILKQTTKNSFKTAAAMNILSAAIGFFLI